MTRPALRSSLSTGWLAAVVTVIAVLIIAAALHVVASSAARRSTAPGTLAEKTAAAQSAARIEPWNTVYVNRARVMSRWMQGEELLAAGDYNAAVDTLRQAYVDDVGNDELLALFKRAQATQALQTNKKAHLQHGHEGPGGTLRPEDIER
jgi:hypothetical protein